MNWYQGNQIQWRIECVYLLPSDGRGNFGRFSYFNASMLKVFIKDNRAGRSVNRERCFQVSSFLEVAFTWHTTSHTTTSCTAVEDKCTLSLIKIFLIVETEDTMRTMEHFGHFESSVFEIIDKVV